MGRAKTKKGAATAAPANSVEEATMSDAKYMAELEKIREAHSVLSATVETIAERLTKAEAAADFATATVERLRKEVARGVIAEGATLNEAEYKAARDGGRREFTVAKDCTHAALSVRAGASMRVNDYSQPLIEDLIGKGALKLKAA